MDFGKEIVYWKKSLFYFSYIFFFFYSMLYSQCADDKGSINIHLVQTVNGKSKGEEKTGTSKSRGWVSLRIVGEKLGTTRRKWRLEEGTSSWGSSYELFHAIQVWRVVHGTKTIGKRKHFVYREREETRPIFVKVQVARSPVERVSNIRKEKNSIILIF